MIWDNSAIGTERKTRTRPSRCYHCGGGALVASDPHCPVCGVSYIEIMGELGRYEGQPWDPRVWPGKGAHGNVIVEHGGFELPPVILPARRIEVWRLVPLHSDSTRIEDGYGARLGHLVAAILPHPTVAVTFLRAALERYLETAKPCPACGAKHALQPYDRLQRYARCSFGCGAIFWVTSRPNRKGDWRVGDRVEESKPKPKGPLAERLKAKRKAKLAAS